MVTEIFVFLETCPVVTIVDVDVVTFDGFQQSM